MVSHSGQEGRLQVLEVSSRSGLGQRAVGCPVRGTQDSRTAVLASGAFGRKEARCKGQQKPESSGGVMLPGKNSSQVEPGLPGSWCQALGGLWQPPFPAPFIAVTPETTPRPPSLVWAAFHQLEAFSPREGAFRLGWCLLLGPPGGGSQILCWSSAAIRRDSGQSPPTPRSGHSTLHCTLHPTSPEPRRVLEEGESPQPPNTLLQSSRETPHTEGWALQSRLALAQA